MILLRGIMIYASCRGFRIILSIAANPDLTIELAHDRPRRSSTKSKGCMELKAEAKKYDAKTRMLTETSARNSANNYIQQKH